MKKPPSASVKPPIHTTQRVPRVSSKPRSGCGGGSGGAPAEGAFPSAHTTPAGGGEFPTRAQWRRSLARGGGGRGGGRATPPPAPAARRAPASPPPPPSP